MKILVLNGPNLNMLGLREPSLYGSVTIDVIKQNMENMATEEGCSLEFTQSNHEGILVDHIQKSMDGKVGFIIINPAAFTHTSIAIRDALLTVKIPFIEVHLSNVHAREAFRQHSYLSDIAAGVICGLGADGYYAALSYAINYLHEGN